jgi:hypothetical protein
VGYEVLLVAVPAGADVEEAGEALLARLVDGHERFRLSEAARARVERLASRLVTADPDLARCARSECGPEGALELRARTGLVVTLADRFARFLVPFAHTGEAAAGAFRQLFSLMAAAAEATGWRPYDPQEGEAVGLDEAAQSAVLEIYLSVMDQLRPAGASGAGG